MGWWGEPVITHRWPLGCWEMTWEMNLPSYQRPATLRAGAEAEAFSAGTCVWSGLLLEPNWNSQEFVAAGHAREAERTLCLDWVGGSTSTPDVAIDRGIAAGALHWIRPASLSNVPFGESDATDQLNYVGALLDAWSLEAGAKWAVGPDRRVGIGVDPTAPAWHVMPDSGVLGVADEEYVSAVFGRYQTEAGAYDTVSVFSATQPAGSRESGIDLTGKGRLTTARAQATVQGILDQMGARTGWTNGVTVTSGQITSPGGTPANLALVRAGQMVRLQALRDQRGLSASTDIVVGESIWKPTDDLITLNPVGLAARDLSSIVERAGAVLS